MSGACLDENDVAELLGSAMRGKRRDAAERHLDECESCRTLVADLAGIGDATQSPDGSVTTGDWQSTFPAAIAPSERIDHFEVIEFVGRGGMGDVYAATDTKLGRKVALKFIRSSLVDSAPALERFEREARATARFSHPNIVTIHFVGEHRGRPYVALEFLEGQTLRELVEAGAIERPQALRILVAIAEGLREAHRHGVLHRDLKPDNVHIDTDGRVRVLDFGLAKFVSAQDPALPLPAPPRSLDEPSEGQATSLAGTPPYMAPEQWQGQPCSEATDIWAFGVLAFALLSGRRPHEATSVRHLRRAVFSERPPSLTEVASDVAPPLATLIARCLEKTPQDRPTSDELIAALRASVSPANPQRRPAAAVVGLGVALVSVAAAVTAFVLTRDPASPPATKPASRAATPKPDHSRALPSPGPAPSVPVTPVASGDKPPPAHDAQEPGAKPAVEPSPAPAPASHSKALSRPKRGPKTKRTKDSLFGTRE